MASFDSRFEANSFLTEGLTAFKTVEGLGLVTRGFLWPSEGIWCPPIGEDVPSTGWTLCPDCSVNGFY